MANERIISNETEQKWVRCLEQMKELGRSKDNSKNKSSNHDLRKFLLGTKCTVLFTNEASESNKKEDAEEVNVSSSHVVVWKISSES